MALGRIPELVVDWSDPAGWLASAEPDAALAALARLVGLAVAAWITATSFLYAFSRLLGVEPWRVRWLSVGPIRRAVDTVLAGALVMGSLAPGTALAAVEPPFSPVSDTATALEAEPATPAYVPIPAGAIATSPDGESDRSEQPDEAETSVVVHVDDNLWKIAHTRLAADGSDPSEADVAQYWVRIIEANQHRLRSGDPDLIFPGEEILLPQVNPKS